MDCGAKDRPQVFKYAIIVHPHKRKRDQQLCDNHTGISLLNIFGKIIALIPLNRLTSHPEQGILQESQNDFRWHRETTDMSCTARQLQETCPEMRAHPYTTFVDLAKSFDVVNHDGLWKIIEKLGGPERFTHMARQLHGRMIARVTGYGTVIVAA
ncbi:unnamed protein product [Schistocephalus solidus]|uniref:Reverse transcriptase domain-containing protein n=1 Tax=Schistocephalus solidus TaxID=70667 RepID=A0A183TH32_SCHSO|nr:unnamed protein product [Schistocephalus solidus]